MICKATGCASPTSGHSQFCDRHKRNKARHGHAGQTSISSAELKPYIETVKKRVEKNSTSPVWAKLDTHWIRLIETAETHLQRVQAGAPYIRYEREAWSDLARLNATVKPRDAVETVLAMYLLQDWTPRRFIDDTAFGFQLVRRVRSLSSASLGEYYDHKTGKQKKVYRDFKPRSTAYLAAILQAAFGVAGLTVARLEAKERQQDDDERQAFYAELGALQ